MTNDFDVASKSYDSIFTYSKIGLAQRKFVYNNLDVIFNTQKKLNILELNCGTGYDAINFAKKKHQVLATDISEGMINVSKQKNTLDNLEFKTQDINNINSSTFPEKFDLIFSNFGGLNCLSSTEIEAFFKTATKLVTKNGKLILVIMPKHCAWEQLYFNLKGDFKKAKRRLTTNYVLANVEGIDVKTWYYNPNDIIKMSENYFNVNTIKPIGLSIPPSYLEKSILSSKLPMAIFKGIDTIFTGGNSAKYADHFLIELQLK